MQTTNSLSSLQKIRTTANQTKYNEPISSTNSPQFKGDIEFINVTLRYDPDDLSKPPAVRGLNFLMKKGERLGCVGKSGAGKSTIVLGLLKFLESDSAEGSIFLDGRSIERMDSRGIRKAFGIMPQAPFLMSATIRQNIDPYNEFDDKVS